MVIDEWNEKHGLWENRLINTKISNIFENKSKYWIEE